MRNAILLIAGCAMVPMASVASAQSGPQGGHVAVSAGTLGFGPEAGYRFGTLGVRGSATLFSFSKDIDSDDINYDGKLKLRSFGLAVDIYPSEGGFRISPGVRINRNRVELRATPSSDVEIGGETYSPDEVGKISGEVRGRRLAPTLTIGYGNDGGSSGIYFGADVGAMLQGSPKVRKLRTTGLLATNAAFQADLVEERRSIEDDIGKFKVYPILQLALGLRFGGARSGPAYVAPPAPTVEPVAPAPATQSCADGSVILASDACPPVAPPPPLPAPAGERG